MVSKYKYRNVTWIDLESPTFAEITDIRDHFGLPELMAEELGTNTLRSKVDYYEKLKIVYLVLHFPVIGEGRERNSEQEIDFVIGKNFIITTRYEKIDPLHNFSRLFDRESFLDKNNIGDHAGYLFIHLMKELYKDSLEKLEDINYSLKNIEDNIFRGKQAESVEIISSTNRKFLNFKQALRHHGEILASFEGAAKDLFGNMFDYNMGIIMSEYNRVKNTLEVGKEILDDLRETNDALLNTKTGQTIKTLTIMTFTLLPITLITGIFSMNMPDEVLIIKDMSDFLLVLILMSLIGLIMFIYFKGKKLL